jgi:hypothetical protein
MTIMKPIAKESSVGMPRLTRILLEDMLNDQQFVAEEGCLPPLGRRFAAVDPHTAKRNADASEAGGAGVSQQG